MTRTKAPAPGRRACRSAIRLPARIDRTSVAAPASGARSGAAASSVCGLMARNRTSGGESARERRIERNGEPRRELEDRRRRRGLEDGDALSARGRRRAIPSASPRPSCPPRPGQGIAANRTSDPLAWRSPPRRRLPIESTPRRHRSARRLIRPPAARRAPSPPAPERDPRSDRRRLRARPTGAAGPAPMPSAARCSGLRRWWVVVSGWVIRLLASPRLLEMPMIDSALAIAKASPLPPSTSNATSVPPPVICRSTSARCGWSARPG